MPGGSTPLTFVDGAFFVVVDASSLTGRSTTGIAVLGGETALRIPSSTGDSFAAHARTSTLFISAHRASQEIAV